MSAIGPITRSTERISLLLLLPLLLLLRPGRGAEYCDQPACLSVCLSVREHISGTAGPIFTKLCMQIPCGRWLGPSLAALRYVMYFRFYG